MEATDPDTITDVLTDRSYLGYLLRGSTYQLTETDAGTHSETWDGGQGLL